MKLKEAIVKILRGELVKKINFAVDLSADIGIVIETPVKVPTRVFTGSITLKWEETEVKRRVTLPPIGRRIFINWRKFEAVADAVESGAIIVQEWRDKKKALYRPQKNEIVASKRPDEAVIVHEAVHAICDMADFAPSWEARTMTVEAIAYLAQAIYLEKSGRTEGLDAILTEALSAVKSLDLDKAGKPLSSPETSEVLFPKVIRESDLSTLANVIANDKEYKASAGEPTTFDGLKKT